MNPEQTHYYLIGGEIKNGGEMPELRTVKHKDYNQKFEDSKFKMFYTNWLNSLQPCSITDVELDKLTYYLGAHFLLGDYPIEVTDIVESYPFCDADCPDVKFGNCCHPSHCIKTTRIKFKQPKSETIQNSIWQKFYDEVKPLLEKYNLNNIDSSFVLKLISDAGYLPPTKQEANETNLIDLELIIRRENGNDLEMAIRIINEYSKLKSESNEAEQKQIWSEVVDVFADTMLGDKMYGILTSQFTITRKKSN